MGAASRLRSTRRSSASPTHRLGIRRDVSVLIPRTAAHPASGRGVLGRPASCWHPRPAPRPLDQGPHVDRHLSRENTLSGSRSAPVAPGACPLRSAEFAAQRPLQKDHLAAPRPRSRESAETITCMIEINQRTCLCSGAIYVRTGQASACTVRCAPMTTGPAVCSKRSATRSPLRATGLGDPSLRRSRCHSLGGATPEN